MAAWFCRAGVGATHFPCRNCGFCLTDGSNQRFSAACKSTSIKKKFTVNWLKSNSGRVLRDIGPTLQSWRLHLARRKDDRTLRFASRDVGLPPGTGRRRWKRCRSSAADRSRPIFNGGVRAVPGVATRRSGFTRIAQSALSRVYAMEQSSRRKKIESSITWPAPRKG